MRTPIALSAIALALALVAAGCGGSDDTEDGSTSASEWASGFCSTIVDWTNELEGVTSQFADTSNLSQDGLRSAADDVQSATGELVDDLRELGAPDTEGGEMIRASLDSLSTTLEDEAAKIEAAAEGISGLTGIPSAIGTITTSLSAMGSAFGSTLQAIDQADVGDELQTALEDSPECAGISS